MPTGGYEFYINTILPHILNQKSFDKKKEWASTTLPPSTHTKPASQLSTDYSGAGPLLLARITETCASFLPQMTLTLFLIPHLIFLPDRELNFCFICVFFFNLCSLSDTPGIHDDHLLNLKRTRQEIEKHSAIHCYDRLWDINHTEDLMITPCSFLT